MTLTPEEMEALKTIISYLQFTDFVLGVALGLIAGILLQLKSEK